MPVQLAFPWVDEKRSHEGGTVYFGAPGMTMRQYYKAAALTGLLANHQVWPFPAKQISDWSAELADAMIAEDEQHEQETSK